METVSPAAQDGSGANPSSVKSEDSTPPHDSGRGSPPPNCAICLGTCRNKCFTDSCLHQFCFKCLLTWSKVKAECPLCKQNFKSIIHNVRSNHQYEEYMVEQRHTAASPDPAQDLTNATRRFRYRTTLTLPRRDSLAIQHLLLHYPMMAGVLPPAHAPVPAPAPDVPRRRRRSPASFRRTVYRHNLWARPLPDFTGRYRDCSPEFYRRNDSQMHRLVPWLNRELHYLLNENVGHMSYVMARVLELLQRHHVNSAEFADAVRRYFGDRTEHFLHELYCFASTPYDMAGYDRQVQYTTDARISTVVNEIISSTDSEASVDSDIVMVSSSGPAEPPPGPSRPPRPAYPASRVVPIETVSHSGSDDDEEVVVVGYIKPPADRTPEVVDLVGSDSDVVVQEPPDEPEPAPAAASAAPAASPAAPAAPAAPRDRLVKLSLTRRRDAERPPSDSDDSSYRPPTPPAPARRPRRKRRRSDTSDTTDTTDPAASEPGTPPPPPPRSASESTDPESASPSSESEECDSDFRRRRNPKKSRRKAGRRRASRSRRSPPRRARPPRKSHAGKGVKRSRGAGGAGAGGAEPSPGPSSGRLRSVVTVAKPSSDSGSSGTSNLLSVLSSAILNPNSNVLAYNSDGGSLPGEARRDPHAERLLQKAESCFATRRPDSGSDPEDDLPLNLSVHRAPRL